MVDGVRLSGALAACLALLLGEEPYGNNGALAKGRAWILSHGGATFIPQWGKDMAFGILCHPYMCTTRFSSITSDSLWQCH